MVFSRACPEFWIRIINVLRIDEQEVKDAREILSLLGYNNLAAISKLAKPHAISSRELQFQKKQETTNCDECFKHIA